MGMFPAQGGRGAGRMKSFTPFALFALHRDGARQYLQGYQTITNAMCGLQWRMDNQDAGTDRNWTALYIEAAHVIEVQELSKEQSSE